MMQVSWFSLFRADKIPWLFPDFSSTFFSIFQYFLMFIFLTENLSILANNTQFI